MTSKAKWKLTYVRNRLGELLSTGGGVTRDEALTRANRLVEAERATAKTDISEEVASLEALFVAAAATGSVASDAMVAMLRQADRLLTLTGTFGFDALDKVVKSFCDLVGGLLRQDIHEVEPIAVHIWAMRLFAPNAPPIADKEAEHMYSELARILDHFDCHPMLFDAQGPSVESKVE